jgi:circadian clock protein KaiB
MRVKKEAGGTVRKAARKGASKAAEQPSVPTAASVVVMCLYIADSAPNSIRAVANLQAICKEHLPNNHKLEIVDVLEYPMRALADGILVTPSLSKLSPFPLAKVIGNLSDTDSVLRALGIRG